MSTSKPKPSNIAEAFRIFIPRALCFLYTLRNKRGFAHVGGDIDSDPIDAATCARVADWILCELIRVIHTLSLEEAQTLVNLISTRDIASVWAIGDKRRVLDTTLNYKNQTLLLLYTEIEEFILIEDLFQWTEHSRLDNFKKNVLTPLHSNRFIEWDKETDTACISPKGVEEVETKLI